MVNTSGTLVVNGITDTELAEILEIKAKHGNVFTFNPQQLQVHQQPQQPGVALYNNAYFGWSSEAGLSVVRDIVSFLLKKDEKGAQAQGQ